MPDPRYRPAPFWAAAAALLLLGAAAAPGAPVGVGISHAWFARGDGIPMRGFFTITNDGDAPLLMTGWQSPACGKLVFEDSAASSPSSVIDTMTVSAKDTMAFARGGYHLICRDPAPMTRTASSIPVTISFRSGHTLTTSFELRDVARR